MGLQPQSNVAALPVAGIKPTHQDHKEKDISIEANRVGLPSQSNVAAFPVTETRPTHQDPKDQDSGYSSSLRETSATGTMNDSQGLSEESPTSDSTTLTTPHQRPLPTQPHVPQAFNTSLPAHPSVPQAFHTSLATQPYLPYTFDTSPDHATFFCDLCPSLFPRRDLLQLHKARLHSVTEMPYLPTSGALTKPQYLQSVTPESGTKHSRSALRVFEGGGLSRGPCQPCLLRGTDCIVNPFASSKCAFCNFRDNGSYCGAAGVKYMYVRQWRSWDWFSLLMSRQEASGCVRFSGNVYDLMAQSLGSWPIQFSKRWVTLTT